MKLFLFFGQDGACKRGLSGWEINSPGADGGGFRIKSMSKQKKTSTYIGGQAVLEGVMMRGRTAMATAVRDSEGHIRIEAKRITPPERRNALFRLPLVRGVYSLFDSLFGGIKTLLRSAEVFGEAEEAEEPSKAERFLAKKLHVSLMDVVAAISLCLGVALALFLFLFLPNLLGGLIVQFTPIGEKSGWYYLIVGGCKVVIFVLYLLCMQLLPDVRRTFMYHGAEHKTITCFEEGKLLTPENAKTCSRVHDRCGTTFLFFVILVNILVFTLAGLIIPVNEIENGALRLLARLGLELVLLPLVAGLSYELLKALARTQSPLAYPLKAPGLLLQRLTTREPDESMLEVAIAAFYRVLEMDADPDYPESEFPLAEKLSAVLAETEELFAAAGIEQSDAEWLCAIVANVPRSALKTEKVLPASAVEQLVRYRTERLSGRPLWYVLGSTEFYGYPIAVDERVLIPRPETEELAALAIEQIRAGKDKVLELCTGSGCIAIALACETGAEVLATDISEEALTVARKNVAANNAKVRLLKSDLFSAVQGKFSLIVSNPPYVPRGELDGLQREVRDFEPVLALDGGEDGLAFYRRIARALPDFLEDGGVLLLECGEDQAEAVCALLPCESEIVRDLEGAQRMVKAVYHVKEIG